MKEQLIKILESCEQLNDVYFKIPEIAKYLISQGVVVDSQKIERKNIDEISSNS